MKIEYKHHRDIMLRQFSAAAEIKLKYVLWSRLLWRSWIWMIPEKPNTTKNILRKI